MKFVTELMNADDLRPLSSQPFTIKTPKEWKVSGKSQLTSWGYKLRQVLDIDEDHNSVTHAGHICSTVYQDAHERLAGLQTAPHRINRHLAQSTGVGQDAVLAAHLHRCTNRLSQDHVPPFFRFSCHFCREGV